MCRRCGEPNKRGNSTDIRRRREWLLSPKSLFGGDGKFVLCWNSDNCGTMLAADHGQSYQDADGNWQQAQRLTVDRICPGYQCEPCHKADLSVVVARDHDDDALGHPFSGGSYRRNNIRPSCMACNQGRNQGNPWGHPTRPETVRCLTR